MPGNVTDLASLDRVSARHLLALDSQATQVLTVNNRHARRLLAELSGALQAEQRVTPLPAIVPLAAWFRQAADQLSFLPDEQVAAHYLDAFAARGLWQQVISASEPDDALLDVATAARLAIDADTLIDEWQLQVDPVSYTEDYQHFMQWRAAYQARLHDIDAQDANTSIRQVCQAIIDGTLDIGCKTLVLAGFNELSPRLCALLSALGAQGVQIRVLDAQRPGAGQLTRLQVSDTDAEWWQAAQWARARLQAAPHGRYAIIATRLEADVALAHRVMRNVLPASEAFNIAVARPLADWPMVRGALAWLQVIADFRRSGESTPARLGAALLAGVCAASRTEASGRARLDARWRQRAVTRRTLAEFTADLANEAPQLHAAWIDCFDSVSVAGSRATLHVWSAHLRDWLSRLGFPGQDGLGSVAFQTLESFDRALGQLAQYSVVWGETSLTEAVSLLQRLARETPFQPQRDPSARLDILGLLEAEGGYWDGVWVLGLTDEILPAPTRPNPLLPMAVLRQAGAPRATPERELQWASVLFDDLCRVAPAVCFSYAAHEGERELRFSPFIAGVPIAEPLLANDTPGTDIVLESLRDDRGPPLGGEVGVAKGGIGLIEAQSRNPLWAFVKYRLGASQLPDYADLSDQNARGQFLHRAMELIWRDMQDQEVLQTEIIGKGLAERVYQHLQVAAQEHLVDYGETLRRLEVERAQSVVLNWLSLESRRLPFVVQAVEQEHVWRYGPLTLRLRLDRVDRLHDGDLAVIDYKTGNASADPKANWARSRPVELQLPFYAAVLDPDADEGQVGALVLAHLHARKCEVKGIAEGETGFEGLAAASDWPSFEGQDWLGVLSHWRQAIERLAQEYIDGVADNRFEHMSDLKYCDVQPFLRLTDTGGEDV